MKHGDLLENLTSNAFDFIRTSVKQLKKEPKYSLINFFAGIELLFKARLMKEHWVLILEKPDKTKIEDFRKGDFRSVSLREAIARLGNVTQEMYDPKMTSTFDSLRDHRNKVVHFFSKGHLNADKAVILDIVAHQCRSWLYVHELLQGKWATHFRKHQKEIAEVDRLMREHKKFLNEKFASLKPKIEECKSKGNSFVICNSCSYPSAEQKEEDDPVMKYACLVCGDTSSYIYVKCTECQQECKYYGNWDSRCPNCNNEISANAVMEQYQHNNAIEHRPQHDDRDTGIAYCHECEWQNPSVLQLEKSWRCFACLQRHDPPDHCEHCDAFITGYSIESSFIGCTQCEDTIIDE